MIIIFFKLPNLCYFDLGMQIPVEHGGVLPNEEPDNETLNDDHTRSRHLSQSSNISQLVRATSNTSIELRLKLGRLIIF